MKEDKGFQKLGDIFDKKIETVKPPSYEWQDLALRIIKDLGIPNFKRGSVFKACKDNSKELVEKCLNDTKELCKSGAQWKYFFKLITKKFDPDDKKPDMSEINDKQKPLF
jgi:hypothetical protein